MQTGLGSVGFPGLPWLQSTGDTWSLALSVVSGYLLQEAPGLYRVTHACVFRADHLVGGQLECSSLGGPSVSPSEHSSVVPALCVGSRPHEFPLWNVCCCIWLMVWGDTSAMVGKAGWICGGEPCGAGTSHLQSGGRGPAGTCRLLPRGPPRGLLPPATPQTLKVPQPSQTVTECSVAWAI